jgi:hypothetical protein
VSCKRLWDKTTGRCHPIERPSAIRKPIYAVHGQAVLTVHGATRAFSSPPRPPTRELIASHVTSPSFAIGSVCHLPQCLATWPAGAAAEAGGGSARKAKTEDAPTPRVSDRQIPARRLGVSEIAGGDLGDDGSLVHDQAALGAGDHQVDVLLDQQRGQCRLSI